MTICAGSGFAVAQQTADVAGSDAGAFVRAAVDDAFVHGFHAGSWVSAGVVVLGAVLAWRFLPTRSAQVAEGAEGAEGTDGGSQRTRGTLESADVH